VLLSRPAANNSANYKVVGPEPFEENVPDNVPDTKKPYVAYTHSGTASVSLLY